MKKGKYQGVEKNWKDFPGVLNDFDELLCAPEEKALKELVEKM